MRPDFSIVLIANKEKMLNEFKENLKQQINVNYELIVIDNYNNEFNSATKAYSSVLSNVNGKYVMFIHPDIRFLTNQTLSDILKYINSLGDFGVVGVAGATNDSKNNRVILSNILHGEFKGCAGVHIQKPEKIQTLDECLFIIENETLKEHPFILRDSWHLYAVEYCLQMILNGKENYVLPIRLWHISDGKSLDVSYVTSLEKLIDIYSDSFEIIFTTVKKWNTRGLKAKLYLKYYLLKQKIKKIIKR